VRVELFLATLLKPLVLLALFIPAIFGKLLVRRFMKDGKLKEFLLR
jgi:hypothetical protein